MDIFLLKRIIFVPKTELIEITWMREVKESHKTFYEHRTRRAEGGQSKREKTFIELPFHFI